MQTVSNQKTVIIEKEQGGKHTIISLEALQKASRTLSGESFKLWVYLAKNQNNYSLALSRADSLQWGVGSSSSYYRAIKELTACGYIQKKDNRYIFYELPE